MDAINFTVKIDRADFLSAAEPLDFVAQKAAAFLSEQSMPDFIVPETGQVVITVDIV